MKTTKIKTSKNMIREQWKEKLERAVVNTSYNNATTHCWRCGTKKRLDRCHIIPFSRGGQDSPDNFVLLCKHCHIDNPNLDDVDVMWRWLEAYKINEGETFSIKQGIREFEFIYGINLYESLNLLSSDEQNLFWEMVEESLKKAGHHFGQPRRNPATVAGCIYCVLKYLGKI